jgi:hypothetical protein
MSGFEDLPVLTRTLSERLHLMDLSRWKAVREAWAGLDDSSSSSIDLHGFYDRISSYCKITFHPNICALEEELSEFISDGSLQYAVSLMLRTDEIMLSLSAGDDEGKICMLDSMAPPETGVVKMHSIISGIQIACLASNIILCTTLPDEDEWSYPPLECDQMYGSANGITALRSLLFQIRHSRVSPLRSLQITCCGS